MTEKTQKPDKRRVRTRGAIMAAGKKLFANSTPEGVTIDDIVLAANIAKGSFYNHFEDKDVFSDAVFDFAQNEIEVLVADTNKDIPTPAIRIVRALYTLLVFTRKQPESIQAINNLKKRKTDAWTGYNVGITSDVEEGILEGAFCGVTVQEGVLVSLGLISVTLDHSVRLVSSEDITKLAISMGASLLRALGVEHKESVSTARQAIGDLVEELRSKGLEASSA